MLKRIAMVVVVLVGVMLSAQAVHAQTLSITKIGTSNTEGQTFTTWTYAGVNPLMSGTASPSATVSITVQNSTFNTTATSLGTWSYQPTSLTVAGSYPVQIKSLSETILFTLNLAASGATPSATPVASQPAMPDSLPETGSSGFVTLLGAGATLLAIGFATKLSIQHAFEE